MPVSQVLLLVSFLLISIQDFKQKAVHIVLYISAFIFAVYYSYTKKGFMSILYDSFFNIVVLFIILGFVGLYYIVKTKKITSPVNKLIGSGDIVFFVILTVLFHPVAYIFFISFSQIIILIICTILLIKKKKGESLHIPLAGALALCYIFFNFGTFFFPDKAYEFQNYLISIM